ncbi:hypothetical protein TcCL_ESM03974 [Trypanosoma cruzi]|nr:hypothetical protein TcCL_ESM03974 [Trypanosoma cruzi]
MPHRAARVLYQRTRVRFFGKPKDNHSALRHFGSQPVRHRDVVAAVLPTHIYAPHNASGIFAEVNCLTRAPRRKIHAELGITRVEVNCQACRTGKPQPGISTPRSCGRTGGRTTRGPQWQNEKPN